MKPLNLTETHKAQLLEMCKVLFPEWDEHCVEIDGNRQTIIMFTNYVGGSEWGQILMHWFEFCMTYLAEPILGKQIPRDIQNRYKKFALNCFLYATKSNDYYIHPIDYLYTEFQNLNK